MNTHSEIPTNQKIISTEDLKNWGYSQYKINKLVEQGVLTKLNKKYYENVLFDGEELDFYYAYAYVPDGVICLMSAAVYYGLSVYRPDNIDVAVRKKKRVTTMPEWPELKLYYFEGARFDLGIQLINDGPNKFKIYDIEKTVCDIIYYRDKVGIEETKEILTNYLRRKDRNLNQLCRYAKQLKCGEILNTYLEVLV